VRQAAGNHYAVADAEPFFAPCLTTLADYQRGSTWSYSAEIGVSSL
jgi:hypothetical protein